MKNLIIILLLNSFCWINAQNDTVNTIKIDSVYINKINLKNLKKLEPKVSKKQITVKFPRNSSVISLLKPLKKRIKIKAIEFVLSDKFSSEKIDIYLKPIITDSKNNLSKNNILSKIENVFYADDYKKEIIINLANENIILDKNKTYYIGLSYLKSENPSHSISLKTVLDKNSLSYHCLNSIDECNPLTDYNDNRISISFKIYYEEVK